MRSVHVRPCAQRTRIRPCAQRDLSDRGAPAVFVGFPAGVKGWSMYNPRSKKVVVSRDVKFLESSPGGTLLAREEISSSYDDLFQLPAKRVVDGDDYVASDHVQQNAMEERVPADLHTAPMEERAMEERDSHKITMEEFGDIDYGIDSPSVATPKLTTTRTCVVRPPGEWWCAETRAMVLLAHESRDLDQPTVKEALRGPERHHW